MVVLGINVLVEFNLLYTPCCPLDLTFKQLAHVDCSGLPTMHQESSRPDRNYTRTVNKPVATSAAPQTKSKLIQILRSRVRPSLR